MVKRPGKIVVPSKLTFNHIISYLDVPQGKIQIIPEGVDLNLFHPDENETSRDMILCTGRFSPNKGHILLIEAFKKFRNRTGWPGELVLAGHYTEKNKHYFESLREMSDEKIKILTDINDEELASLYRQADFCVYPSVSDEGWGLVVVEAFASGKPVICSDLFLETGVASEERAYIVPRGDISSLVDAMRAMITSPEMKARLAAEGLAYANGLNWGKMVESIEKAICEVISENEKK